MSARAKNIFNLKISSFAGLALYLITCVGPSSYAFTDRYCRVFVKSVIEKQKGFHLRGCEVGGNVYIVGPFVAGKLIVDLRKLYHWDDSFNAVLQEALSKSSRYASLDLIPFNLSDRAFAGALNFNGVKSPVQGYVILATKNSLEARLEFNLLDFDFRPTRGSALIDHTIAVTAKVRTYTPKNRKAK